MSSKLLSGPENEQVGQLYNKWQQRLMKAGQSVQQLEIRIFLHDLYKGLLILVVDR